MDDEKPRTKPDNLTRRDRVLAILKGARQRRERSAYAWKRTLAITTAAHIMFARPNSLDDSPTSWPENHPKTSGDVCRRGAGLTKDTDPPDDPPNDGTVLWRAQPRGRRVSTTRHQRRHPGHASSTLDTHIPPHVGNALTISATLAPARTGSAASTSLCGAGAHRA